MLCLAVDLKALLLARWELLYLELCPQCYLAYIMVLSSCPEQTMIESFVRTAAIMPLSM